MSCSGCPNRELDNKCLTCNTCKSIYCYECLNIDVKSVDRLTRDQLAALKCPSCTNVTRRRVNDDNMPVGTTPDRKMERITPGSHAPISALPSSSLGEMQNPEPLSLESISKLFDEKLSLASPFVVSLRVALKDDIKELVAVEMKSSMTGLIADFTTTTDFLTLEQTDIKNKIAERDQKIQELEQENIRVQRELVNMHKRMSIVEKISRDHNVEIQGVPESKSENLIGIFKILCDTIASPIMDSDIRGFRRVAKIDPSSTRPRNIIVTLSSPRLRDQVLSAVHRFNKGNAKDMLSSRHLGLTVESKRVYVVEHLSPDTKQIHAAARKFARDNGYKYVWVKFGQVFLRKDDASSAIRVKSVDFLKTLETR